jgi:hypothetical protein
LFWLAMQLPHSTRRKAIIGLGGIATGTAGTVLFGTENAQAASINLNVLEVGDLEHTGTLETLDIVIDTTIEWEADSAPSKIETYVETGRADNTYEVQRETVDVDSPTGSTDKQITANVLEAGNLAKSDFELFAGQPKRDVDVSVVLGVEVYHNGSISVSDEISTQATVTVNEQTATVTIGGVGELQANQ